MKLEIGKEYVTRNGLKVKIYDIAENDKMPIKAGIIHPDNSITLSSFSMNGQFFLFKTDDWDIVGEWQEPLDFDWSCLPVWCNEFIAMDEGGKWYAFSDMPNKPNIRPSGMWCKVSGESTFIPKEYAPKNFKGTWENSLFKNPNIK